MHILSIQFSLSCAFLKTYLLHISVFGTFPITVGRWVRTWLVSSSLSARNLVNRRRVCFHTTRKGWVIINTVSKFLSSSFPVVAGFVRNFEQGKALYPTKLDFKQILPTNSCFGPSPLHTWRCLMTITYVGSEKRSLVLHLPG